jgi:hypothetical protein
LRFELPAEGDATRLVLIDELPPDAAARNAAGWERSLDRLAGLEPAAVHGSLASSTTPQRSSRRSAYSNLVRPVSRKEKEDDGAEDRDA